MNPLLTVQQSSATHNVLRALGWGVVALVAVILPYWLPLFQVGRLNRALVLAIAILGVNLVIGFSGLLALGHSAFIGMGAFIAATFVVDEKWDYWQILPVAFVITFLVGVVLGVPALRIKGLYLALVTISFAVVFPSLAKIDGLTIGGRTIIDRTGGANGRNISSTEEVVAPDWLPSSIFGTHIEGGIYRYWIILAVLVFAFFAVHNIIKSRPGRAIIAIRDNEIGAAVSGVNLPATKVLTFGLSAALAGVAGVLLAMDKGFAGEQDFGFVLAVELLVGLVVGGLGRLYGPIVGAMVVVFVREATKTWPDDYLGFLGLANPQPLSLAFFGVILIVFTFFAPGGLVSLYQLVKSKIIRVVPRPPEIAFAHAADADDESASSKSEPAEVG